MLLWVCGYVRIFENVEELVGHRVGGDVRAFAGAEGVLTLRRGGIVIANEDGNNQIPVQKAGTTPDWGPRAL